MICPDEATWLRVGEAVKSMRADAKDSIGTEFRSVVMGEAGVAV